MPMCICDSLRGIVCAAHAELAREVTSGSGAMVDVVAADGTHRYWSTHCRHGNHEACAAVELAPGVPRRPAQCKTCGAPCQCPCGHGEGGSRSRC